MENMTALYNKKPLKKIKASVRAKVYKFVGSPQVKYKIGSVHLFLYVRQNVYVLGVLTL